MKDSIELKKAQDKERASDIQGLVFDIAPLADDSGNPEIIAMRGKMEDLFFSGKTEEAYAIAQDINKKLQGAK